MIFDLPGDRSAPGGPEHGLGQDAVAPGRVVDQDIGNLMIPTKSVSSKYLYHTASEISKEQKSVSISIGTLFCFIMCDFDKSRVLRLQLDCWGNGIMRFRNFV